uniref:ShKT domain-containing protein n=1 Tax=Varanus komodoensis TaxID=61221 RepID=A0A8D2J102_VARKO
MDDIHDSEAVVAIFQRACIQSVKDSPLVSPAHPTRPWSGTAARNVKYWADRCIYKHSSSSQRTIENGVVCGEDLFYAGVPIVWSEVIRAWFKEKVHFTQVWRTLVWYKSYLIACAVSKCQHKIYNYFYVCYYCPGGNAIGINYYTPYKRGQPCHNCPQNCDDGLCSDQSLLYEDVYSNCVNIKKRYTCNNPLMKPYCSACCQCTSEIQ